MEHTTWEDWSQRFPDTLALSDRTGFDRNYQESPYVGYENDEYINFPINNLDERYHPKELIVGVKLGDKYYVYPFSELSKSKRPVEVVIDKQQAKDQNPIQLHH